jgi:hypothetical protein
VAVLTRVSSPALIGRGEERTELRRVLGEVLAGGSACVVVAGEAGLGTTRLDARTRAEVAAIAHRDGLVPVG